MVYYGTVTFTAQVEADDDDEARLKVAKICADSGCCKLFENTEVIPHYEDD